ncbi:MAG: phosphoribosylaminoimidazolesuccinocarboxamide synthase [Chloroflexi bacterium RBG_13_46_14]|nr:MAG: phosphoribosylaminoimidazolesuccinocarboxamide synthase [Chloroflexi bacterium RBG_13_46_14]
MSVLLETNLPNPLLRRGKVRDNYDLDGKLLIVATDRISAFDVVLPCGIPDKGAVLNQLSAFWFRKTDHILPNHLLQAIEDIDQLNAYYSDHSDKSYLAGLAGRSMVVRMVKPLPVECVVRGYLAGSVWVEYVQDGTIHGIPYPQGLQESQQLSQPIFTPTTKAESGHDKPLTMDDFNMLLGESIAEDLRTKSISIYRFAEEYARTRGIIIADTKMEFGLIDGQVILIDELLTPDSSRFWDVDNYVVGRSQPSFDKQIVRDWLTASGWNKEPPAPMLPPDLIQRTSERYQEVYQRLTGKTINKYQ